MISASLPCLIALVSLLEDLSRTSSGFSCFLKTIDSDFGSDAIGLTLWEFHIWNWKTVKLCTSDLSQWKTDQSLLSAEPSGSYYADDTVLCSNKLYVLKGCEVEQTIWFVVAVSTMLTSSLWSQPPECLACFLSCTFAWETSGFVSMQKKRASLTVTLSHSHRQKKRKATCRNLQAVFPDPSASISVFPRNLGVRLFCIHWESN